LFLVASRDIYTKTIIIANIYINIFKKLRDTNTIIVFANTINNLYIDRDLDSCRIKNFYLLKFKIDFTN